MSFKPLWPAPSSICRIKALTTGRISSYADVVRNFASQQLQGDSIVDQWKLHNRSRNCLLLRLLTTLACPAPSPAYSILLSSLPSPPSFMRVASERCSRVPALSDTLVVRVSSHRRMVFYGDETWVRLFPSSFLRQDPTTSFFVTDYTEVEVEGRSGAAGCAGRPQRHQAPRPGAG